MNAFKKNTVKFLMGIISFAVVSSSSTAFAIKIDMSFMNELQNEIHQRILKMQQETLMELYPQMPLKDQMRGRMMIERATNNYMQYVIQPKMMEDLMEQIKPQQMQLMVSSF
jgi:hypothetical protein